MSLASKFSSLSSNRYPVTEALAKWDGKFTPQAVERVQEVMRKDLLTAHRDDGSGRIRPSMLGLECDRPALLSYEGEPADGFSTASMSIMNAGTFRHYYWQMVGLSAGFLTDIEAGIEHKPWQLRGSLDGVLDNGEVFELKSVNSRKFAIIKDDGNPLHYKPVAAHVEQVHPYMLARDTKWTSLVYEDRNFLSFIEVRVRFDEGILTTMNWRAERWNAYIDAGTLPPIRPDCLEQTGTTYRYCGWKESCFRVG